MYAMTVGHCFGITVTHLCLPPLLALVTKQKLWSEPSRANKWLSHGTLIRNVANIWRKTAHGDMQWFRAMWKSFQKTGSHGTVSMTLLCLSVRIPVMCFSSCFRWEAIQVFAVLLCFYWQKLSAPTLKDTHTRKALPLPVLSLQQVHAFICHKVDRLHLFHTTSVTKNEALHFTSASRRRA